MEELNRITVEDFKTAEKTPLIVVLDNVRSQNNIGSVFRTSDAFRVEEICLCGICSTPPHRDIHKTALGAEDSVEWKYYEETTTCIHELKEKGYYVISVEQVDESMKLDQEAVLNRMIEGKKIAIVFGNEVDGVDEKVIELSDECLEIPQYGTKHSLNISIAAGIVIWEMWKILRIKN